jgi:hypothetical protein
MPQFFYSTLAFYFFTLSCFAPISSPVRSIKGHITCQGACAKGLEACYIPLAPLTCPRHAWHGPKSCLEMPRALSTLDLGLWLTSESLPSGNWGRLTQHNFSSSLLEQDLPCKLPRAGHKVIWTVRSPHWFWTGRHIRCSHLGPWALPLLYRMMCSPTSERFASGNWRCLTQLFPLPSGTRSYA